MLKCRELKALWDEELCEAVQRERQAMTQRLDLLCTVLLYFGYWIFNYFSDSQTPVAVG